MLFAILVEALSETVNLSNEFCLLYLQGSDVPLSLILNLLAFLGNHLVMLISLVELIEEIFLYPLNLFHLAAIHLLLHRLNLSQLEC